MPAETFETKDSIPEELRDAAIETKDGKFVVVRDPDVSGLTSALEKERKARRDAEKAAKEREARLAELEEERQAKAAGLTGEKLEEIRKQAEAKFAADLAERDQLKQRVRALTLDTTVKSMLAKAEFVDVDAAWKLFGDEFDLTDDLTPIVKADPAKKLEQHIADLAAAKPYLVKGTAASGGGASGNRGTAAPQGKTVFDWTQEQRAQFIQQHGPDAYRAKLDEATLARITAKQAA